MTCVSNIVQVGISFIVSNENVVDIHSFHLDNIYKEMNEKNKTNTHPFRTDADSMRRNMASNGLASESELLYF